ncbi:hypothetical protein [Microbulbifer donghaiensis]|uniref:hypothetical protein n=1 Tax=Microbulbifer donghaiensis TaxID=494016 RepID=UPI0011610C22|nr:hypothetical protein [Microbulbifer donghaiensis]
MSRNFQIRYQLAGRIVRLHFIGRVGLAERLQAAGQVAAKFRHLRQLRLFVDTRYAETAMTSAEQRQFVDFVLGHPVLRRARIAVLYRTGCSPVALMAQRMSGRSDSIRPFLVESEALAWLCSQRSATRWTCHSR